MRGITMITRLIESNTVAITVNNQTGEVEAIITNKQTGNSYMSTGKTARECCKNALEDAKRVATDKDLNF